MKEYDILEGLRKARQAARKEAVGSSSVTLESETEATRPFSGEKRHV